MRAIQRFLPNPRHVEYSRIFVTAKPNVAWQTARHFNFSTVPWVKLLFDVRTFADQFQKQASQTQDTEISVDQVTSSGKGFFILYEKPGEEVIIGSVGQFWHLKIPFAQVEPKDFIDFKKPGWGKLAWNIRVEPYLTGSTICLELRTTATDEDSWRSLKNYYNFIGIGSKLIRHSGMSHLKNELGQLRLPDENKRQLQGDNFIPSAKYVATDSINIEAPIPIVWRYLMQLGCDRGGWYSIDLLDNGGTPSVNYLVDDWADRKVGDKIAATPKKDSFFEVYELLHEKYFVMGNETEKAGVMQSFKSSWAFVLEPIGDDATHLVARARMEAAPKWAEWMMGEIVYPPVHGLMAKVQLKNIKKYAERDAQMRIAPAPVEAFHLVG